MPGVKLVTKEIFSFTSRPSHFLLLLCCIAPKNPNKTLLGVPDCWNWYESFLLKVVEKRPKTWCAVDRGFGRRLGRELLLQ